MIGTYRNKKLDMIDRRLLQGIYLRHLKDYDEEVKDANRNRSLLMRIKGIIFPLPVMERRGSLLRKNNIVGSFQHDESWPDDDDDGTVYPYWNRRRATVQNMAQAGTSQGRP